MAISTNFCVVGIAALKTSDMISIDIMAFLFSLEKICGNPSEEGKIGLSGVDSLATFKRYTKRWLKSS
jgi:hypothetical protein